LSYSVAIKTNHDQNKERFQVNYFICESPISRLYGYMCTAEIHLQNS